MNIVSIVRKTRYLVIIPIAGLALAAAVLFVAGGIGLLTFLVRNIQAWFGGATGAVYRRAPLDKGRAGKAAQG